MILQMLFYTILIFFIFSSYNAINDILIDIFLLFFFLLIVDSLYCSHDLHIIVLFYL